jgi:hypothetical protein
MVSTMPDLAQRVVNRFIEASAQVVINEVGDDLVVSGPYDKMKGLLTYLKGQGFKYHSGDRSWTTPKRSLTPLKLKNLQKRVDAANGVLPDPGPVDIGKEEARKELVKGLFEKALEMKLTGVRFLQHGPESIQLEGNLYDLEQAIKKSGGDYDPGLSSFNYSRTKPKEFEDLLVAVGQQGDLIARNTTALGSKLPRSFQAIKVTLAVTKKGGNLLIEGNTYPYNETIKDTLSSVRFLSSSKVWAVPMHKVRPSEVEKLLNFFEGLEEDLTAKRDAERKKWQAEKAIADVERARRLETRKTPNRRGDNCADCGGWVAPGDGYITRRYDDEEDKEVWDVRHSNPNTCESILEEERIRQQKARTKRDAVRNLQKIVERDGVYVEGNHVLKGTEISISSRSLAYGGGEWVVIEPDEKHFWYVLNNGADGDDWSRNNVQTGGAGAIGRRVPLTEEAKVLIEVAKE